MSSGAESVGGTVTPLRVPAQVIRERVREIGASFPGWTVFHDTWSDNWRQGEEPDFRRPVSGRRFMVSTYDVDGLVTLLECQVGVDIGLEFPRCRVRQARAGGGWSAVYRDQLDGGGGAVVRLVRAPAVADLHSMLRALVPQTACQRRRP